MLHIRGMEHSIDEYLKLLREAPLIAIDNTALINATKEAHYTSDDYRNLAEMFMIERSNGRYRNLDRKYLTDFLLDNGATEKDLTVRGRKSLSVDMYNVIMPLIKRGVCTDVLTNYIEMAHSTSHTNFLESLQSNYPYTTEIREDNVLIRRYDRTIEEHDNLRVYYKNIAVVSIPVKYSSIITIPSTNYIMVWCDYPQADWRFAYNMFIRNADNAEIMDSYEDTYEGIARIVEGDSFNYDDFKINRKKYKENVLSTFYNSSSNEPLVKTLRQYFMKCPRYASLYDDLRYLYKFKMPIPIKSYFGYEQLIPEGNYTSDFISKAMNTPVQTMTSHAVIESLFGVLDRFYEAGYSKEDIMPYFTRHDEVIFLIKSHVLKDAWLFGDCSEIHIDGFSPIKLEFNFGYNYKQPDKLLQENYQRSCESNKDKYKHFDKGEMNYNYSPIPVIRYGFLRVDHLQDTNEYEVTCDIFNNNNKVTKYNVQANSVPEAVQSALKLYIKSNENVKYLYFLTLDLEGIERIENTVVKYDIAKDPNDIISIENLF